MPVRKPLAAIVLAVLLGLSAAQTAWSAAQDGNVESMWNEQQQGAAQAGDSAGAPLCSVDTFKQSALLNNGAWPGVGPFHGQGSQLTDASQNKLTVGMDKNRIMTVQMLVTNRPKDLLKLQIAADFLLEAVGATPGRISQFNSQLAKSSNDLRASSSHTPLNLHAGRYQVAIYPDSAGASTVSYVVRITSKEAETANIAAKPPGAPKVKQVEERPSPAPETSSQQTTQQPVEQPTAEQPMPATSTGNQTAEQPAETSNQPEQPVPTTSATNQSPATSQSSAPVPAAEQPSEAPTPNLASGSDTQEIHPAVTSPDTTPKVAVAPPTATIPTGPDLKTSPSNMDVPTGPDLKTEFADLLSKWEQIKRVAMSKRDAKDLSLVLAGKALAQQTKSITWLTDNKKHYDLVARAVSVNGFQDLEAGRKYAVYAQITEDSKLINDTNNDVLTDKTNTYNVNYTVEKIGGRWTIVDSSVMNQNGPKSLANSPAKSAIDSSASASAQTATKTITKTNR